jgi:polysaccharide deacetylase 2 family uncharacterized protein YibQ
LVAFRQESQRNSTHFLKSLNRILLRLASFGAFSALIMLFAGCNKSEVAPLPPSRIHAITQQLAAAAASGAPPGSLIKIKKSASDQQPGTVDEIFVGLENGSAADTSHAAITKLLQSLDAVATRNRLTRDSLVRTDDASVLILRRSGVPTHRIEIGARPAATPAPAARSSGEKSSGARLAIILDDLGSDRTAAEAIFALHYPLTVSVLPNHEHSVDIAEEAHRRGYQVMLHLPMQAVGKEQPEAQELHPGMKAPEVVSVVEQFLQSVPDVIGVNNHQGSQATADAALMSELMPILRDNGLFYVDSRTTAATVAFDTAQRDGVRSGFRNVPFLDDVAEVAAVRKQLELALRGAREKGEAIAIGNPHPATLQALREVLPQAEAQGVHLVFVSELVH